MCSASARSESFDENAIEIVRVFAAPRSLVFAAWMDPEHLRHWTAPHGFVVTQCEGQGHAGGRWRCCMRSPEGKDLWVGGVYRRIIEDELIEMTHAWEEDGHETVVTVRFEDDGTGTRMIFRQQGFDSAESRDGHGEGWAECFERLETLLAGGAA